MQDDSWSTDALGDSWIASTVYPEFPSVGERIKFQEIYWDIYHSEGRPSNTRFPVSYHAKLA